MYSRLFEKKEKTLCLCVCMAHTECTKRMARIKRSIFTLIMSYGSLKYDLKIQFKNYVNFITLIVFYKAGLHVEHLILFLTRSEFYL